MKKSLYSFVLSCNRFIVLLFALFLCLASSLNAQYTGFDPGTEFPAGGEIDLDNTQSVEMGVKFTVAYDGQVNGIRFYKGPLNTGTHIGNLWDNSGNLLATVDFSGESASGWQEMSFSSPVAVTAGAVYVASYFSPTGRINATGTYFSSEKSTGLITLIADADDPELIGNGVFTNVAVYTDPVLAGAFPNTAFNQNNYWVDINYTPIFPLPVTLTDFKATTSGENNVVLSWETASEQNNKGFEIQRSNNGTNWYPISFLNADGESSVPKNYNFTDKQLAPGNYYYRLNQQDFDGKSKLSSIVTATVSGKGTVSLLPAYPNPIKATGSIRFDLPVAENIRLSIVDLYGREIKLLENKKADKGSHLVTFNTEGLSKQLYYIRLQTENGILTRKIIVQ